MKPGCRLFTNLLALLLSPLGGWAQSPGFVNVAPGMGIDITNINGLYGSGVSLYDYDGDGWDDLTLGINGTGVRVYHNDGGLFVLQPQLSIPMTHNPKAVQWVDVDDDSDADLFVVQDGGPTRVFEQLANGSLQERSSGSGLPVNGSLLSCAAWADVDGDGDLDVYIGAYAGNVGPNDPEPTEINLLFRNDGNFHFADITDVAGVSNGIGLTLAVSFLDVDNDGDPDLLVANDKTYPNALYLNDGTGIFTDGSAAWGFDMVIDAMTLTESDFNHDGLRDILITNTVDGQGLENMVYSLVPFAPAQEVSETYFGEQLHDHYMWGGTWLDIDNDADRDLFIAEHDLGQPFQANPLFINAGIEGNYAMTWAPDSVFPMDFTNAHVVVQGDWDGNGWPDFAVHNVGNHKLRLWRNMMAQHYPDHHWIKVEPVGIASNSMGVGAWIEVFWDHPESPYRAYTYCGQDFLGQTSRRHHIGLGTVNSVDSVRITWPSGVVDVVVNPDVDGTLVVEEGETWLSQVSLSAPAGLCPTASGTMTANLVPGVGVLWPNGLTGPTVPLQGPGTVAFHWVVNGVPFPATHTVPAFPPATLISVAAPPGCHDGTDGSWQGTFSQGGATVPTSQLAAWSLSVNGLPWDGSTPITGLSAGNISVQWTDGNGCPGGSTVTLTAPPSLQVAWGQWDFACDLDTVWTTAMLSGGTPPYALEVSAGSMAWTDGAGAWQIRSGQPSGEGTWTDANGCLLHQAWEAPWHPVMEAEVLVSQNATGTAHILEFEVNGGAPPASWTGYYHPFDLPSPTAFFEMTDWAGEPLIQPAWGHYVFLVEDARGCAETFALSVHEDGISLDPDGAALPDGAIESHSTPWRVGPNPTSELLHIHAPVPVHCQLRTVTGELAREIPDLTDADVSVADLPAGLYCLHCSQAAGRAPFAFRTTVIVE
jgi:hypothetical protein